MPKGRRAIGTQTLKTPVPASNWCQNSYNERSHSKMRVFYTILYIENGKHLLLQVWKVKKIRISSKTWIWKHSGIQMYSHVLLQSKLARSIFKNRLPTSSFLSWNCHSRLFYSNQAIDLDFLLYHDITCMSHKSINVDEKMRLICHYF